MQLLFLFLVGIVVARPALAALRPLGRINVIRLGIHSLRGLLMIHFWNFIFSGGIAVLRGLERGRFCLLRGRPEIFVLFIVLGTELLSIRTLLTDGMSILTYLLFFFLKLLVVTIKLCRLGFDLSGVG